MPQLDVSTYPSQIFWLLTCFLLLFLGVRYLVTPKIQSILDTRNDREQNNKKRAKELAEETTQLLEATTAQLMKAREEAAQTLFSMEEQLRKTREEKLRDLQKKLDKITQEAEAELQTYREELYLELHTTTKVIASDILETFGIKASEKELEKGSKEPNHVQ